MKVLVCISLWVCCWLALGGEAQAKNQGTGEESYTLRVENIAFGRIEMSADDGKTFVLVGRVLRSATSATPLRAVKEAGKVSHSSRDALAFGVAPGMAVKLRPQRPAAPASADGKAQVTFRPPAVEPGVILTDIPVGQGIFGSMLLPMGTVVRLPSLSGGGEPITTGHSPSESDVYLFQVTLPRSAKAGTEGEATLAQRIEVLSKVYIGGAVARAKAENRKIVSGSLTLRARLPEGEPDPIDAVVFLGDSDLMAAQNTPPFTYVWDTRKVPDGEHVVEIRAFNKAGRMLTRVRALVVVQNSAPAP